MTTRPEPRSLGEALALLPTNATVAVRNTARDVSREFHGITDPEDLVSEFYAWVAQNPKVVLRWLFTNDDGEEAFGWKPFRRDTASVMARAARRDKAHRLGYEVDDEQFYQRSKLLDLLPYMWHDPVLAVEGEEQVRTSTTNDPALGGDRNAEIADVRRAYNKVVAKGSKNDSLMFNLYARDRSQQSVAEELGVTQQVISYRHTKVVESILKELNGTMPFRLGLDGPGSRRAMSNQAAISLTHRED